MERFSVGQVESDAGLRAAWGEAARVTPGISVPGSGPDWGLAAHGGLHGGERGAWCWHAEDHWVALALGDWEGAGAMVQGLEAAWGFACPVVGPDPAGAGLRLLRHALGEVAAQADGLLLGGIPRGGALDPALRVLLTHRYGRRWTVLPGTDEVVADLAGGVDAWWRRRSARFRAGLRTAARRTMAAGLRLECCGGEGMAAPEADRVFQRILAADARTWKAREGQSVFQEPSHEAFYRDLVRRSAADGRLWTAFAVDPGGVDVGYLVGYCEGEHFRGLQLGYDPAWAACTPGHLLQREVIAVLGPAGVRHYNLGMDIDYKRRWADQRIALSQFVALGRWNSPRRHE